jgi:cytochrome c biogenesis protein CcmG, thiol:disulfide interchange protein DsbE
MRSEGRGNQIWMYLFLAMAALLVATRWHLPAQSGGFTPAANRHAMRDVALPQLGGGEWRLADHRRQVVLINYWATWCEPCKEELPGLMQVARESEPKSLAVVGVAMDTGPNSQARVQQFAAQYRLPYPVAFPDAILNRQEDLLALPTTVLIDKHGRVAKTYTGAVEQKDFAKDVAVLLGES